MDNYSSWGSFLVWKRLNTLRNLKETAELLNITSVYLSEMENNKKTNPSREIMQKLIEVLCLDDEEIALFYDLHAKANGIVSQDLPEYIMGNGIVRNALRKAKDKPATDEDWQGFIRKLK